MAVNHDVTPLLRCLLPHLVHAVFNRSEEAESEEAEPEEAEPKELAVLKSLLQSVPLSQDLDQTVAR